MNVLCNNSCWFENANLEAILSLFKHTHTNLGG